MEKAVLVMDMPEGCFDCKFWYFGLSGTDYCLMYRENRKVENIDIHTERPDWCPLVPEPERMTEWEREQGTLNDRDYEIGRAYVIGMTDGWNACLDVLEGKT